MLLWIVAAGFAFVAFILVSVVILPSRQTRGFSGSDYNERLELAKLRNDMRKTNATIVGGVFIFAGIATSVYQTQVLERELNEARFNDAVEKLGSQQEFVRMAGVHELSQVEDYASSRSKTAKGTLLTFVHSQIAKANKEKSIRVQKELSEAIDNLVPEENRSEVRVSLGWLYQSKIVHPGLMDETLRKMKELDEHETFSKWLLHALPKIRNEANKLPADAATAIAALSKLLDPDDSYRAVASEIYIDGEDFRSATMNEWELEEATFSSCDFSDGSFKDANLAGASFEQCILRNADFSGANISRAKFSQCDLASTKFDPGALEDATVVDHVLQ